MSSVRRVARFAYAAGATGILTNLLLIAFYALLATHLEVDAILGSASDLVGSLATAFMIPVALALAAWLPDRRSARVAQAAGVTAMAVLTVSGPLLVLGVLRFNVDTPISVAAWMVLYLWLVLFNRWLRLSGALRPRVARLGGFLGAAMLAGAAVVGLGFLLPWMSWPQLIVFGVGGIPGFIGWLGIPVRFLLLGRHLGTS